VKQIAVLVAMLVGTSVALAEWHQLGGCGSDRRAEVQIIGLGGTADA